MAKYMKHINTQIWKFWYISALGSQLQKPIEIPKPVKFSLSTET